MAKKPVTRGATRTRSVASAPDSSLFSRFFLFFQKLGPGIVTGAADDDPSGIATYSQVGAQFGFSMLWTMLLTYPLMAGIQEISAWIGRVTGVGIAANIRRYYSPTVLYPLVALLLIANVINLGADIGAMGAALRMLVGGPAHFYALMFGVISVLAAIIVPYEQYARILKWSALVLFVYIGTAVTVHIPLHAALVGTVVPKITFSKDYLTALTAVFGTTISPYLFFWQASMEAQDVSVNAKDKPLKRAPEQAPEQFGRIRFDTYVGMALSNTVAFFIILTSAVTLHTHGILDIQTADQAAKALEPLAGRFAFLLFAIGIVG